MRAQLRLLPFDDPIADFEVTERLSIAELLNVVDAPDWFMEHGIVKINDHEIPVENWQRVRLRPEVCCNVDLIVVPGNRSTAMLLASVALAVAVTAISAGALGPVATGGIGLFGSAFAGGTVASSIFDAGVATSETPSGGTVVYPPLTQLPYAKGLP